MSETVKLYDSPLSVIRTVNDKLMSYNVEFTEITGVRPVWTDKTKTIYGSDGTFVTIDNVYHF